MVEKVGGKYCLKSIIDFEQCIPTDKDEELVQVYLPLIERHKVLGESFKSGYEEFASINLGKLKEKKDFYNLSRGLKICAWAKNVDYNYYLEGIKILEEIVFGGKV